MPNPQFCVVCGRSSQRASWPNSGTTNGIAWVACDFHSLVTAQISAIDSGGIPASTVTLPAQNGKKRHSIFEAEG